MTQSANQIGVTLRGKRKRIRYELYVGKAHAIFVELIRLHSDAGAAMQHLVLDHGPHPAAVRQGLEIDPTVGLTVYGPPRVPGAILKLEADPADALAKSRHVPGRIWHYSIVAIQVPPPP